MTTKVIVIPWDDEPHYEELDDTLTGMYRVMDCTSVEMIEFGQFDMWFDGDYMVAKTRHRDGDDTIVYEVNRIATGLVRSVSPGTLIGPGICGHVVLTGPPDRTGNTMGVSEDLMPMVLQIWRKTWQTVAQQQIAINEWLASGTIDGG